MAITDPRDIPDLVAWYSAEAETGYTDGQAMTGWTDLSGNGNHATVGGTGTPQYPLWQATTGPSGGPAVRFPNGTTTNVGWFAMPDVLSALTAGEMLVQIKSDGTTSCPWRMSSDSGGPGQSLYPYSPSNRIFEAFGVTSRYDWTPTVAITEWRRYGMNAGAGTFQAWLDESSQKSGTQGTGFPTAPIIGSFPGTGYLGHMTTVVIYGRKLTTTERADLNAWMVANPSGGTVGTPVPTGTLAATLPALTADLSGAYTAPPPPTYTGDLEATLPAVEASLSGTYQAPPVGDLAATLPALTVDLAGTYTPPTGATPLGTLDATLPALAADLVGAYTAPATVVPVGTLDATLPALTATLTGAYVGPTLEEATTDRVNRIHGRTRVMEWSVEVEPPIVEPTRDRGHDKAVASTTPVPTLVDGRPT